MHVNKNPKQGLPASFCKLLLQLSPPWHKATLHLRSEAAVSTKQQRRNV